MTTPPVTALLVVLAVEELGVSGDGRAYGVMLAVVAARRLRMRGIVEAARRRGFAVRNEKDRYRPTHLGEKPPSTTSLCSAVVSETPGLGEVYYRNLSAVAHSTGHGLSQHVRVLAPLLDTTTGDAEGLVSMTANDAALRLFGAPLAAVTVVSEVFPICGWRVPDVEVKQMLSVWGRSRTFRIRTTQRGLRHEIRLLASGT